MNSPAIHSSLLRPVRSFPRKALIRRRVYTPCRALCGKLAVRPEKRLRASLPAAFPEELIQATGRDKFRSRNGMVFTCHAVRLWAYAVKRTVPCDMPYYYLNSKRAERKISYAVMPREKNSDSLPPFLCINDVGEAPDEHSRREDMRTFPDAYYPEASAFEIGGSPA